MELFEYAEVSENSDHRPNRAENTIKSDTNTKKFGPIVFAVVVFLAIGGVISVFKSCETGFRTVQFRTFLYSLSPVIKFRSN